MTIAIEGFRDGFDIGGAQLQNKILGARDPTKHDWARRNGLGNDATAQAPDELALKRKGFGRGPTREHDGIGTAQ